MITTPTWATLRKYCRPGMPVTAQVMGLFRLANNERRDALRVAWKANLGFIGTNYNFQNTIEAKDIPVGCSAPYAPCGNVQSQLNSDDAISGNLILEAHCFQTKRHHEYGAFSYWLDLWLWGTRPMKYGHEYAGQLFTNAPAWARYLGSRTYGYARPRHDGDVYESIVVISDRIGMFCDRDNDDDAIFTVDDTDWRGNTPPFDPKDRLRPFSPVNSRMAEVLWLVLNKLRIVYWMGYDPDAGGGSAFGEYWHASEIGSGASEAAAEADTEAKAKAALAKGSAGQLTPYFKTNWGGTPTYQATLAPLWAICIKIPGPGDLLSLVTHIYLMRPAVQVYRSWSSPTASFSAWMRLGVSTAAITKAEVAGGSYGAWSHAGQNLTLNDGNGFGYRWAFARPQGPWTDEHLLPNTTSDVYIAMHHRLEFDQSGIPVEWPYSELVEYHAFRLPNITTDCLTPPLGLALKLDFEHLDDSVN